MHDVITKTLPAGPLDDMIAKVEAEHLAKAAAAQDSAMIERDLSRGARPPAPVAEDPLVFAVSDAITALREHMFECAVDECQSTGRDPDYTRADAAEAHLLKAIDDLIADRLAAMAKPADPFHGVTVISDPSIPEGLLVEHKPGARVKGGAL